MGSDRERTTEDILRAGEQLLDSSERLMRDLEDRLRGSPYRPDDAR